jgi:hypothetical protein
MRFLVDECTGRKLLASYADRLPDGFVVVTERQIRFATT